MRLDCAPHMFAFFLILTSPQIINLILYKVCKRITTIFLNMEHHEFQLLELVLAFDFHALHTHINRSHMLN